MINDSAISFFSFFFLIRFFLNYYILNCVDYCLIYYFITKYLVIIVISDILWVKFYYVICLNVTKKKLSNIVSHREKKSNLHLVL